MAAIKTIDFLPEVFRSTPNKKFLSATLDQLVAEPNFKKINGYIGRRFAPTFKVGDNYITEPDQLRQQYQLEPGVTITDNKGNVDFFSSYTDLLQKINYYGGRTDNHSRLFDNEYYSFDGLIDFDKLVNFNQYYWLPSGPPLVDVFSGTVDVAFDYTVAYDAAASSYQFTGQAARTNPDLVLARGGTYKFILDQPGSKFWIQSEPGVTGISHLSPTISTRPVLGVENNGDDRGEVVFNVPQLTAQDFYIDMPIVQQVDAATPLSYNEIQGQLASTFVGFDGLTSQLDGKYIIFAGTHTLAAEWTGPDIEATGLGTGVIVDPSVEILYPQWYGIWQVRLLTLPDTTTVIDLVYVSDIPLNHKVYIKTGDTNAAKEFFKNAFDSFTEVPLLTAPLDTLYYQDGSNPGASGKIRLVDVQGYAIDVDADVLGQTEYTSPNGVVFANGLRVKFDNDTIPPIYAGNTYYVEGVGVGIKLVDERTLSTPELITAIAAIPYDIYGYDIDKYDESLTGPLTPDYITINRASIDGNPWSRSNRWVHSDILKSAAVYNNTPQSLDQLMRATRPIIEFDAGVRLFNTGTYARHQIDILDFTVTDALNQIEGSTVLSFAGTRLRSGMQLIFANDVDPTVRNRIFVAEIISINGIEKVHLTYAADSLIEAGDNVVGLNGATQGISHWYDGIGWNVGQQKTSINQPPLFDVFDVDGVSLGNKDRYVNSSFVGTSIFTYKVGTGRPDSVLGFPLSYRNFNNVGDIEFANNFDSQSFTHLESKATIEERITVGNLYRSDDGVNMTRRNTWIKNKERSKQYQIISSLFNGDTNYFEIDILPEAQVDIPYLRVYVNSKLLQSTQYEITSIGVRLAIRIDSALSIGDTIDILIYSKQVSLMGHYEVPLNLDYNTLNKDFASLTLGQFRNHLTTMAVNHSGIVGSMPGDSNVRNLEIKSHGGSILQHSAPTVYGSVFLIDEDVNFISGIEYAQREYSKFKNKFFELALSLADQNIFDPRIGVDTILRSINAVKNSASPWYYSDMVPYDENKTVTDYTVINASIVEYEIGAIFKSKELTTRAVLVYLNGEQLLVNNDFYFNQDRASIVVTADLVVDDQIQIHEYHNTNGCYIPETPTKLGLYQKFAPQIFVDNTYSVPTNVIRGHDGSTIPAFNDFRDSMILELEYRIYNNIKVSYDDTQINLHQFLPGKFRDTDYSLTEFDQILTGSFLKWIGNNRVDYTSNSYFVANDPWTWNYKGFRDTIDGEYLPGFWRGIYNNFYDTDRPHTHPWEMLGFGEKPNWWEENYGPAPYTGGNQILWDDLEAGRILAGDRAGIDPLFARPGLSTIIPVDEFGALRSPEKFAVENFNSMNASGNYSVGDQAPVESSWRRSSDYPFAVQRALALAKPGLYFGLAINVYRYNYNQSVDQILNDANQRITPTNVTINGDTTSGTQVHSVGYLNWIADYLRSLGIEPVAKIRGYLDYLDIKLGYKVAGYTDKSYLKILAEQSSPSSVNESVIIPDENYTVHLHKSTPIRRIIYSAVIIEKSTSGYSVTGYDLTNPHFTIIPSDPNSNQTSVKVGTDYAVIYKDYKNELVSIPYGTEFKNKQQLVDFLISYGRFLTAQGFLFNDYDPDMQVVRDWVLSAREFLTWTQQGWAPGSLIVVSPAYDSIKVYTGNSVVDEITNAPSGSKLLDAGFNVIKKSQFTVGRDRNRFEIATTSSETMAFIDLNLVQYEHVLIFDNATIFNDIIYKPELGNRQFRLQLVGNKTGDWTGRLDPAGFIYSDPVIEEWSSGKDYLKGDLVLFKNNYYVALQKSSAADTFKFTEWKQLPAGSIKKGLMPNFAYNAQKFVNIYDIDNQIADNHISVFSNGIIGYRDRPYLSALSLDPETQSRFYQGYIKEKGTKNAFDALANAKFSNLKGDIDYYEEWAVRVGEYGAIDSNQSIDITLAEPLYTNNPSTFVLLGAGETVSDEAIIGVAQQNLYKAPTTYTKDIFRNRTNESVTENDIQTAGYVNLNDIDATIFDIAEYAQLDNVVGQLGNGFKVWVAKDVNRDWNVYRITETMNHVIGMAYALNEYASIETEAPHQLRVGEVFAVRGFEELFDGFYRVDSIESNNKVTVVNQHVEELRLARTVAGNGILFKLQSMRYDYASGIADYTPKNGWRKNDRVWVDNDAEEGIWGVYQKSEPWALGVDIDMTALDYVQGGQAGRSIKITDNRLLALIGSPGSGQGNVQTLVKLATGEYVASQILLPHNIYSSEMGYSVDIAEDIAIIGAPGSDSNKGHVFVYQRSNGSAFSLLQVLTSPTDAVGDRFGEAVAISRDGVWVYVGAPGANKVHAYRIESVSAKTDVITGNDSDITFALAFDPHSEKSIVIRKLDKTLVYGLDYTVTVGTSNNSFVHFAAAPLVTDQFTVTQSLYFDNVTTIGSADSMALGDRFGASVQTSDAGEQFIIGAPGRKVGSLSNAGTAYVFDRHVHNALGDGNQLMFNTDQPLQALIRVFIDGVEQVADSDFMAAASSITFVLPPAKNAVVRIETNNFSLLERLEPETPTYNGAFGYSVEISNNGDSALIGAPGFTTAGYNGGAVYRYVNRGQIYSTIKGSIKNPSVVAGDSIRINDYTVILTGTTLTQCIADIVAAAIPGVTAVDEAGFLRITVDTTFGAPKLHVLPGVGTALFALGLDIYQQTQEIRTPYTDVRENFGQALRLGATANTLIVSSQGGSTYDVVTFDRTTATTPTVFDGDSTSIFTVVKDSGAAYVFELMGNPTNDVAIPAKFVYAQQLRASGMDQGDNFATAVDIVGDTIFVGAPMSDDSMTDAGAVYRFVTDGTKGWTRTRAQEPKVDLDSMKRAFVYSKKTQTILTNLDYIDPAKGKILGAAEQDLDYKTSYDPARYNAGFREDVSIDTEYYWNKQFVGRTWWDLDAVRFIDYEQGNLTYRAANWGRQFDGSSIDVYEWVESNVPPSQYTGEGTPKHTDDSAYVDITSVDPVTEIIRPLYYFWVSGKRSVDTVNTTRRLSTSAIAEMIDNPRAEPVAYAALIRSDAMSLFNVNNLTVDNDTILHVSYAVTDNDNLVHAEYELIQENNGRSLFPEKLVAKLIDSLAGADKAGRIVPDVALSVADRYGISVRPRQSMVINRATAVKNFVNYANGVFAKNIIAGQFDLSRLHTVDPIPSAIDGPWDTSVGTFEELSYINTNILPVGFRVLVESDSTNDGLWTISEINVDKSLVLRRIQGYNTTNYWEYVTWYDESYDPTINATYTVDFEKDIAKLAIKEGDTLHIRNNGSGQFVVYRAAADLSLALVGLQNGTIRLSDALYKQEENQYGFDNESFDSTRYDVNPSVEFGYIFEAIYNDIFTASLTDEKSKLMFMLVNYIMSEQKSIDWIFKTSFISVIHRLRKLGQFPSFLRDNQDYYQDYINEVKPYRTKIREYLIDYEGQDDATMVTTDFDLPPYYDPDYDSYRSPSGEKARDDLLLSTTPEYSDWYNHHAYEIGSAVISNPGTGYIITPEITVVGGGGSGAIIKADVDAFLGTIVRLRVINPGSGYTSTPTLVVNGTGTGGKAYAQLANGKVRGFTTSMKFDRVGYNSVVVVWDKNIAIPARTVVSYEGVAVKTEVDINTGTFFDITQFVQLTAEEVSNLTANDRIIAYYRPTVGMTANDLKQLITGIEYRGVKVIGPGFDEEPGYDVGNYDAVPYDSFSYNADGTLEMSLTQLDAQIQSAFADAALGTRPEDVIVDGSAFVDTWNSHAPEELLPGMVFDALDMQVFTTRSDSSTIGYRISKSMIGIDESHRYDYHRITAENTTELAVDLLITDTTITVVDASRLPNPSPALARPGIVYINGEKITYYSIDYGTNTLGRIRRAVSGTGAPAVHAAGLRVVDASFNQEMVNSDFGTWLNVGSGALVDEGGGFKPAVADGLGLEYSTTAQGQFINAKVSYTP